MTYFIFPHKTRRNPDFREPKPPLTPFAAPHDADAPVSYREKNFRNPSKGIFKADDNASEKADVFIPSVTPLQ